MKKLKILSLTALTVSVLVGCFPKASEVIRALPVESKEQILAQYNSEQIAEGKVLFTNNCGKCHDLKQPETRNPEQWNRIVKRMIPKAKLNDRDGQLVRAYLIVNAKEN
ncbi:c-type cytochrome [Sphingobacterium suaedae]|uniref:C-type cytochrome n=1 Tax=Sphingobacterium suaedae TaxID=1686402 RepID=A0ABW5KDS4_9SPHI